MIIGIGNILLSDEGFGVHVINELKKLKLPPYVEVYDGATLGLEILNLMDEASKAVIVDAVRGGNKPGTIYRFKLGELMLKSYEFKMISMHELDFATAIKLGRGAYKLPEEILVIGVEPKRIEIGLELSDEVKKIMPEVLRLIFKEIEKFKSFKQTN